MEVDDVMSTESALVAAATAAIVSPRARAMIRKGAVYAVAGVLKAGDVAAGAGRGMARGVRGEETTASDGAADAGQDVASATDGRKSPAPQATNRRRSGTSAAAGASSTSGLSTGA